MPVEVKTYLLPWVLYHSTEDMLQLLQLLPHTPKISHHIHTHTRLPQPTIRVQPRIARTRQGGPPSLIALYREACSANPPREHRFPSL